MIAKKHLHREDLVGKVIDAHSHIGIALREAAQINFSYCSSAEDLAYRHKANGVDFGVVFPISPVADENPIHDLLETYRLMFPRQTVTPAIFGPATQQYDLAASNRYASEAAAQHDLPSFLVTRPEWSAQELEQRVVGGGFLGLKPYLEWAPPHIV